MEVNEQFMRRALQLAANGRGFTSPNPMVGAVIVVDDVIVGEGWHRRYGGPHAEVNAVNSVADKELLRRATIYVTLEPCSHYGKTPPCADLIVRMGIPRVVVGSLDPNEKVAGRGIRRLLEAGCEVVTGVLEDECRALNVRFMTAHTLRRPYVMLKWASSADGFIDIDRSVEAAPVRFSTDSTLAVMHALRAEFDAILVGSETVIRDNPSLTVRLAPGRNPRPVVMDRRRRLTPGDVRYHLTTNPDTLYVVALRGCDCVGTISDKEIVVDPSGADPIGDMLADLFSRGITSVMVEGGATVIRSFIASGHWDSARVEINPNIILNADGRANSRYHLSVPDGLISAEFLDGNTIITVTNQNRQ